MSNGKNEKIIIRSLNESIKDFKHESYFLFYDEEEQKKVKKSLNEESEVSLGINKDAQEGKISKSDYSWTRVQNSHFIARKPNQEKLPSGYYSIRSSMTDGLYLESQTVTLDDLFQIPNPNFEIIVSDFRKFWASKQRYKDYGFTYKRGVLMHGPQGTGKSSLINLLINDIINTFDGIVLNVDQVYNFIPMIHNLRALEPDRPIMALMEDFDSILYNNSTTAILNLLDGNLQVDNIIYFAATNYLDRIEPRIKNRPSRFDLLVEIPNPDDASREFFLKKKLKPEDLSNLGESGIKQWVADTKNMSFSHLRELIASVVVMGNPYKDVIKRLQKMNEIN
jgi:hypothetical protein